MAIVGLVLGAMAFGIGMLVLLNWRDKKEGKHDEQASYQVQVGADDELTVVEAAHPEGRRHRLGGHGLIGVIEATADRNDVRIHEVTLPDGREVDFEDYDQDEHGVPELLLAEDSRGLIEIRRDGRIRTRPPVDDAVREDLERILETALERSTSGALASPA